MNQRNVNSGSFLKKENCERIENVVQKHILLRLFTSHVALAFCYGIFLLLYEIIFLRETVSVVHPFLIGWAGILALYDIAVRRLWKKLPMWQPLLVFIVTVCVTSLLNRQTGLVTNIKTWVLAVLPLVAFLPVCFACEKENQEKALLTALSGGAIVISLASLVAVLMYMLRISTQVELGGITRVVGFRYHIKDDPSSGLLVYGLYSDTNHAAAYALVFAAYSLWLLDACRRKLFTGWKQKTVRGLAVANLAIQMCYFPLANSRGGWLGLIVAGLICWFLYAFCTRLKTEKKLKRAIIALLSSALAVVLLCGGLLLLRSSISILSRALVYVSSSGTTAVDPGEQTDPGTTESVPGEQTDPGTTESVPGEQTDPGSTESIPVEQDNPGTTKDPIQDEEPGTDAFKKTDHQLGSGRLGIWKEALEIYTKKPLFGTGPGNGAYYANNYDIGEKLRNGTVIHNSFLDLLVAYGIVGFMAQMCFFVGSAVVVLRKFFAKGRDLTVAVHLSVFCVVFLAGVSFFLTCMFINTTAMYFLLLCLLSFALAQCNDKDVKV